MKAILINLLLILTIFIFGCFLDDTEKYLKDLQSGNNLVKNEAIYRLGENKEKGATLILIGLLKNDQPKETRLRAIDALGKIGESNSVDPLIEVLKENDKEMRLSAVEALGKIKDPRATPSLISALEDKDIQIFVIWALGNIEDKRAVPALTRLLDSQDKYVRYNTAQSLKRIGNKE